MEVKTKYKIKNKYIKKNWSIKGEKKNVKKEILLISIFIIIQTIIYVICGINKSYIHMDEAYSLGLANYDKVEIQNNEDFYNIWHNKEYYEDYLAVQSEEIREYNQVYENQKNDVHPPLYYLILRFAMGFSEGHFSKWSGIAINIIVYIFITIFMYLILKKLFKEQTGANEKAIILSFMSSVIMSSLTNVIYIRMYALSTLNILITTFLHIKLTESENVDLKLMIFIGLSALIGSLTHYYYLFYLAALFILVAIKYIKEKEIKMLSTYMLTMGIAGVLSLVIFPYSIQHMFFGYRGQGVISNLTDIPQFIMKICGYVWKVNYYGFNNLLFIIIIVTIGILVYKKKHNKSNIDNKGPKEILRTIYIPTIFYSIIVAIASPFVELRYIMPVCSLIFILIIYYLYQLLKSFLSEKKSNYVLTVLFVLTLISPVVFKIEPETTYSSNKEVVQKIEKELNVPTIYMFKSENNRFLDDILLFSKLNESYIAKDIEHTEEKIKEIFKEKDISKGIIIFINENQNNDEILNIVKEAISLKECEHLKRLNACDVYYLK